jgi:hypothetical protein
MHDNDDSMVTYVKYIFCQIIGRSSERSSRVGPGDSRAFRKNPFQDGSFLDVSAANLRP